MGSPGADGNTMAVRMPPTVPVEYIPAIEDVLIFSQVSGKRNWDEVLREIFSTDYPDPNELDRVVLESRVRIENGYVPIRVLEIYEETRRENDRLCLK